MFTGKNPQPSLNTYQQLWRTPEMARKNMYSLQNRACSSKKMSNTTQWTPPIHAIGGGKDVVRRWYGLVSEQSRRNHGAAKEGGKI